MVSVRVRTCVSFWTLLCIVYGQSAEAAQALRLYWPVPSFTTNNSLAPQDYAEFSDVVDDKHHTGLDIPAPAGTPVVASHSGTVIATLLDENDQKTNCLGNVVVVSNSSGFSTLYSHLSTVTVSTGDVIEEDEAGTVAAQIGTVGGTAGKFASGRFCDGDPRYDPDLPPDDPANSGLEQGDGLIAVHLHYELKNHSGLGAADDVPAWGYVPELEVSGTKSKQFQPEAYGYLDPVLFLHIDIEELEGDAITTQFSSGLNTRHGPGVRYGRTAVLGPGERLQVMAFVPGDDTVCTRGWYQVRKPDGSYIADEIDILDSDGSVPETWVCAGNASEIWLNVDLVQDVGLSWRMLIAAAQTRRKPVVVTDDCQQSTLASFPVAVTEASIFARARENGPAFTQGTVDSFQNEDWPEESRLQASEGGSDASTDVSIACDENSVTLRKSYDLTRDTEAISFARGDGLIDFTVEEDINYELEGELSQTGDLMIGFGARLRDLNLNSTVFHSNQVSVATPGDSFVLGRSEGDFSNIQSGRRIGRLSAGHSYRYEFGGSVESTSNPNSASGASSTNRASGTGFNLLRLQRYIRVPGSVGEGQVLLFDLSDYADSGASSATVRAYRGEFPSTTNGVGSRICGSCVSYDEPALVFGFGNLQSPPPGEYWAWLRESSGAGLIYYSRFFYDGVTIEPIP